MCSRTTGARVSSGTYRVVLTGRPDGEARLRLRTVRGECEPRAALLSVASNSKKVYRHAIKAGHGRLALYESDFTPRARKRVRECCAVLEAEFPRERCLFITATLPGSARAALKVVAEYSSYIMGRCVQWLRDTAPGAGIVGVWELQRRGALHAHWAIGVTDSGHGERIKQQFKTFWIRLLRQCSERGAVDLFQRESGGTWLDYPDVVRCSVEQVQKSVGRYLSKYVSKGSAVRKRWDLFLPVRWWHASRWLRDAVAQRSLAASTEPMPWARASELFDQIAGAIVSTAQAVFPIRNVFRPLESSISAWFPDGQAAREVVLDAFAMQSALTLRRQRDTLGGQATPDDPPRLFGVAAFFKGRLFCPL